MPDAVPAPSLEPATVAPATAPATGPCEGYVVALDAMVRALGVTPLPRGLNVAEFGDWKLTANGSADVVRLGGGDDLAPWSLLIENTRYLVIGIMDPFGGAIGGMTEDEFIAAMRAYVAEGAA